MGILEGKVAVITGGSRGLGFSMARAFAREGAAVMIASRSEASVSRAVSELQQAGARAAGMVCDAGDQAAVDALAAEAIARFGRFDVWVNNAAVSAPYGPTTHVEPAAFRAAVETNILGTYYGSMAALRHFLPRGSGKLINLLGRGDRTPTPLQNAYAASKAWVRSFTISLAKENAGKGVEVIAFNPGLMMTDMLLHPEAVPGYEEKLKVLPTVLRLFGNPPELPAERAVRLASAATDGRNGVEVHVLTRGRLLRGVLQEGLRRLTGRV